MINADYNFVFDKAWCAEETSLQSRLYLSQSFHHLVKARCAWCKRMIVRDYKRYMRRGNFCLNH
jgi:hypothetical protein